LKFTNRLTAGALLSLSISTLAVPANGQPFPGLQPDAAMPLRIGRETNIPLTRFAEDTVDISLDGRIDETVWQEVPPFSGMAVVEPETLAVAPYDTQMRLFYTERGLYIAVDMEQPPETLVRRITGRDNRNVNRDRVSITLDSSGEGQYGYWMSLALGDNQLDGTILPERQYSSEWDGAWYGATAQTDRGWSAEFFIPWGQLSMPRREGERQIGFYAERIVAHLNQNWAWPAIAKSDPIFLSNFPLLQMEGINPRQQWSVFPSISSTYDEVDGDMDTRAGVDLFWRPSSNFQVTATLNPDFGSAESDNVVVNLTASETFFPENRLFFQEGQEIFNTTPRATGSSGKRFSVINTRRIGGRPPRPELPQGQSLNARQRIENADLMGAVKATGQTGNIRYGILGAMEDDTDYRVSGQRVTQDGRDFTAFRILYEDSHNATYRGLGYIGTRVGHPDVASEVHAVDFHYLTTSGRWNIDGQLVTSDVKGEGTGYGAYADIIYRPRQGFRHTLNLTYLDDTLDVNAFGFQERNNVWEAWYRFEWIKTDLNIVRDIRVNPFIRYEENLDGDRTNNALPVVSTTVTLNNLDRINAGIQYFPKRYDDLNSFGNGTFAVVERTNYNISYTTNTALPVSYNVGYNASGEFAGGRSHRYNAGINWRAMDNLNFSAEVTYEDRDRWLLHQRNQDFTAFDATQWRSDFSTEFYLTANQQFTAALQWVGIKAVEDRFYHLPTEAPTRNRDLIRVEKPTATPDDFTVSQLNFQLRYRWQIAPLSDLFIVYTKNDNRRRELTDFNTQFSDSWRDPLVSQLVVKLRYRFGT